MDEQIIKSKNGKVQGANCPRCGSVRVYRDKYVAERNKDRQTCEKCRSVKWIERGTSFGNWTVIGGPFLHEGGCKSRPDGYVKWLCRCNKCGKEYLVNSQSLHRKTSLGCMNCQFPPEGQANFNARFGLYKKTAQERNLVWELDESRFAFLVAQPCIYCGRSTSINYNTHKGEFKSNGIDRIDSSKGYTSDNVIPCCKNCNYAKRKMSLEEFAIWICSIVGHPEESEDLVFRWEMNNLNIRRALLSIRDRETL